MGLALKKARGQAQKLVKRPEILYISVFGEDQVGKSSLVQRYVTGMFTTICDPFPYEESYRKQGKTNI